MAAAKIRKGDRVVVLSGKDKGKTGEVVRSIPKDMKVVVSGVNVHARHRKPSRRCTCPRLRLPIPRAARRPASASRSATARRSASRPSLES